jgi:hypothetical protein
VISIIEKKKKQPTQTRKARREDMMEWRLVKATVKGRGGGTQRMKSYKARATKLSSVTLECPLWLVRVSPIVFE